MPTITHMPPPTTHHPSPTTTTHHSPLTTHHSPLITHPPPPYTPTYDPLPHRIHAAHHAPHATQLIPLAGWRKLFWGDVVPLSQEIESGAEESLDSVSQSLVIRWDQVVGLLCTEFAASCDCLDSLSLFQVIDGG